MYRIPIYSFTPNKLTNKSRKLNLVLFSSIVFAFIKIGITDKLIAINSEFL